MNGTYAHFDRSTQNSKASQMKTLKFRKDHGGLGEAGTSSKMSSKNQTVKSRLKRRNRRSGYWEPLVREPHYTSIRPQSAEITTSNSQAVLGRRRDVELPSHTLFELPHPVARDGQVRVFAVLQTNVQRSSGERRDFLDPLHVHDRAPVDADKFLWVEFFFQFRNRVVHAVRLAFRHRISQFVLGIEMCHPRQLEE